MEKASPPVPQPRRHIVNINDTNKLSYENVDIDIINKNISIKHDNLQSANNKLAKIPNNKVLIGVGGGCGGGVGVNWGDSGSNNDDLKNVITEMNNLNMDKNKNLFNKTIPETRKCNNFDVGSSSSDICNRPIPAPRRTHNQVPQIKEQTEYVKEIEEIYATADDENEHQPADIPAIRIEKEQKIYNAPRRAPDIPIGTRTPPTAAAAAAAPTISTKASDRLRSNSATPHLEIFGQNLEKSRSNSSISSSNSGHSSASHSSKYTTTSPGSLLKSLGATSKLLTESISERITTKTNDAKYKIDKMQKTSRTKLSETTKTASLKLKEVRKSLYKIGDNFTLGRPEKKSTVDYDLDRPQTVPASDEIFQSISFYSPLNSKSNNCENLLAAESSYEIPKHIRSCSSDLTDTSPESSTSLQGRFNKFDPDEQIYDAISDDRPIAVDRPPVAKYTPQKSIESSSSMESIPCPSYPPPINREGVYGKLNQSTMYSSSTESDSPLRAPIRHKRKKDYEQTEIRLKPNHLGSVSNRATCDSNDLHGTDRDSKVFPFNLSSATSSDHYSALLRDQDESNLPKAPRSESWNFYDINTENDTSRSSPEPIYANEATATSTSESVYGLLCNAESPDCTLLSPQNPARKRKSQTVKTEPTTPTEILKEFDPLIVSTIDHIFSNKSNELILLESLLGEETYGHTIGTEENIAENENTYDETSDDESLAENVSIPTPPERQDSLVQQQMLAESCGSDNVERRTIIIHQNMSLRSDSIEDMLAVEDAAVAPYLARADDSQTEQSQSTSAVATVPPESSRSKWFVSDRNSIEPNKFHKSQSANSINTKQDAKTVDKVIKNIIKRPKDETKSSCDLPSYTEAMGETISEETKEKPTKSSSMKTMFSSVFNRMEGINLNIKRKTSFKSTAKSDVKVTIEMIPKPPFAQHLILHEGHLVRLPSCVVDDILKEQQMRKVYLRDHRFQAYFEKDLRSPKENILLDHITTIQCVSNHKFSNNSIEMHCFEITTAIPKCSNASNMSNPNVILTASDSGNFKSNRICHLYGVPKESERYIWMQKLLESLTDVFPAAFTSKYYRAGWCYMKNSITSQWAGAWILLQKQKRKLVFYNYAEMNLEYIDLRKARCLVLKENDDSIKNLHIESGPILMIDCPPFTIYMIMCSPRETKIWRHIIREVAHNNGPSLKEQQLTKDMVPVLVDKCINFIYAQGSMSEGIYRKSGLENSIQKLLTLFRTDAFSVQITRTEYNEHDVANALKRFMRDLPDRFLGKYSASFISVSEMNSKTAKIGAYTELLSRLPPIEYHTLKKLIGHLNFIQSQKSRNKMGIENLAIIWGPTLLQDKQSEMQYSQKEADVINDLICLYKNLYKLTNDEIAKEQIMLSVLKKYHAAAENLNDAVKKSGDLKVWITIDPNPDNDTEEKQQINVTLTPTKTAYDICKELASKMKKEPFALTLSEIILNGDLHRPLHYSEKVFDIVLRWSYWPDADRKDNYLQIRPIKFIKEIERALKNLPTVSPNKELKFADSKTKSFKSYTLEVSDGQVVVMKKDKNTIQKVKEIDLKKAIAYIGCEKKRDFSSRWAITLIESDPNKNILRTRESPFIGHVIAGTNSNDSIVWFSSIWHNLYGDDIMPNPEIVLS